MGNFSNEAECRPRSLRAKVSSRKHFADEADLVGIFFFHFVGMWKASRIISVEQGFPEACSLLSNLSFENLF